MLCFSPDTLREKKKRSILGRPGSQISSLKRQECVETLHVHPPLSCSTNELLSQPPPATRQAAPHHQERWTTHFGSWKSFPALTGNMWDVKKGQ